MPQRWGLPIVAWPSRLKPNFWDGVALPLVIGSIMLIAWASQQMSVPYHAGEALPLSLDPWRLPEYAIRTVMRMALALAASLVFSLAYAALAAKSRRAEKLLRAIDVDPPDGAWKVVAVTEAEISTTKGSIVDWGIGGLGNIGDRSCVVSTYLLRKHTPRSDSGKLRERLRKLAIHEFGHTLGLHHCPVFGCVMNDAQGKLIRSLDTGGETFCGRCRKRLPAQAVRRESEFERLDASTNAANSGQTSRTTSGPTSP